MLTIYRGPTRAFMDIHPTHEYALLVRHFQRNQLGEYEYDVRNGVYQYQRSYTYFDEARQQLNIPVNYIDVLSDFLNEHRVPHKVEPYGYVTPRRMTTTMKPGWTDRPHQVSAIDYLTNGVENRLGLQLDCGLGKTYTSIKSMINRGDVGMVVVSRLVDQWISSICDQTTVGDRIWVLQGYDTINRLLSSPYKPDIFVASLETLRAYANNQGNYQDLPSYREFLQQYGVGTKIMDEVHLNFYACTMLDLKSDIRTNIYLTATFTTANKGLKKIFERVYPMEMRFGAETSNRHVDIRFHHFIGRVQEKRCMKQRGYSHVQYEKELLKRPTKFQDYMDRIIVPEINMYYINTKKPGYRCLIFFATIKMAQEVQKRLRSEYKDLKIMTYVDKDPETNLQADVILSTFGSAGCGTDIKLLKTVINTISHESITQVLQALGRLRELPGGEHPIYVDNIDDAITAHQRHGRNRKSYTRVKAHSYQEHTVS